MEKKLNYSEFKAFKEKIILLSKQYSFVSILNSCELESPYTKTKFEYRAALGIGRRLEINTLDELNLLDDFVKKSELPIFGGFSYDLRDLKYSNINKDFFGDFPKAFWVEPEVLIDIKRKGDDYWLSCNDESILARIASQSLTVSQNQSVSFDAMVQKDDYISTIKQIKKDIVEGDYYELNYCVPFKAEYKSTSLEELFVDLNAQSAAPFSAFIKYKSAYLLSASPERYMRNINGQFLCQPIKGTSARSIDRQEDEQLKKRLLNSEKERAENVMIVDLMRNDLSMNCKAGTVKVAELFGIYSFSHVHQMISTIIGNLDRKEEWLKSLLDTFPMGSMTGAPKKIVMERIDQYEPIKRGIYSGTVGYIEPNGDFDLNVIIRSLIYSNNILHYHVGGAITFDSNPELEYEECLVKARTLLDLFNKE